jgi:hypothetical protein
VITRTLRLKNPKIRSPPPCFFDGGQRDKIKTEAYSRITPGKFSHACNMLIKTIFYRKPVR